MGNCEHTVRVKEELVKIFSQERCCIRHYKALVTEGFASWIVRENGVRSGRPLLLLGKKLNGISINICTL